VDKTLLSINNGDNVVNVIRHGSDALVWQTLASVLIPGKVINIVTNTAARLTNSTLALQRLPPKVTKWLPTAIGLVTIPFIVHPIDTFVDLLLDNTLRLL
jgi:fission process protein 1